MNTVEMDVIIAGIIGFVIGAILVAIVSRGNKGKHDAETAKLQAEYDAYREEVNAHFAKTADAVDGLTRSYQQVFAHLSDGAQNLMDKKALQAQLDKRQGKAVTLAYLVDQEEVSQPGKNKAGVAGKDDKSKQIIEPAAKKEAPVPAEEKAAVVAYANDVKTPADKKTDVNIQAGKETVAGATRIQPSVATSSASTSQAKPQESKGAKAEMHKSATVTSVDKKPGEKAAADKVAMDTVVTEKADKSDIAKSNVQKAAEKAGLKPADDIASTNEHETAIESVKKHIKDGKGSKA